MEVAWDARKSSHRHAADMESNLVQISGFICFSYKAYNFNRDVNEYSTMHYCRDPRHPQSMMAFNDFD